MTRTRLLTGIRRWYVLIALPLILLAINGAAEHADVASYITYRHADDYAQALFRWHTDREQAQPAQKNLFIIGNSAAREALSPSILKQHVGIPTYSFALTSSKISDYSPDLLPIAQGDILVIALNEPALDDRTPSDPTLDIYKDPTPPPYLIQHRRHLAETSKARLFYAAELLIGTKADPVKAGEATRLFRFQGFERLPETRLSNVEKRMLSRLAPDDKDHALTELEQLARIQAGYEGVQIVVLALPDCLPQEVRDCYDRGVARALEQARTQGLTVIDARSLNLSPEDYYDFGHVLESGRRKISHFVAVELKKHVTEQGEEE